MTLNLDDLEIFVGIERLSRYICACEISSSSGQRFRIDRGDGEEKTPTKTIQSVVIARTVTRAQLSLRLADRTHGAHSQPESITVRV